MCPATAEEKRLLGYRGKADELIEGERWMLSVARLQSAKAVPRFRLKVDAAYVMASFSHKAGVVLRDVKRVSEMAARVVESQRLARTLEYLLAIGNIMNHGEVTGVVAGEVVGAEAGDGAGGGAGRSSVADQADDDAVLHAHGFTIDSLLKLASARSTNGQKLTVLDFYVQLVVGRGEVDLLRLEEDLEGLAAVARLSNAPTVANDVGQLEKEVVRVEKEYELVKRDIAEALKAAGEEAKGSGGGGGRRGKGEDGDGAHGKREQAGGALAAMLAKRTGGAAAGGAPAAGVGQAVTGPTRSGGGGGMAAVLAGVKLKGAAKRKRGVSSGRGGVGKRGDPVPATPVKTYPNELRVFKSIVKPFLELARSKAGIMGYVGRWWGGARPPPTTADLCRQKYPCRFWQRRR